MPKKAKEELERRQKGFSYLGGDITLPQLLEDQREFTRAGQKAEKELYNFLLNNYKGGGRKLKSARDFVRFREIANKTATGLREGKNVQLSEAELDILRKAGLSDTAEAYNGLMRKHTNPELLDRWERIHGKKFDTNLVLERKDPKDYYTLELAREAKKNSRKLRKKAGEERKKILNGTGDSFDYDLAKMRSNWATEDAKHYYDEYNQQAKKK